MPRRSPFIGRPPRDKVYGTKRGVLLKGAAEDVINSGQLNRHKRKVDLIFTSPPFPLNTKKRYGNLQGQEYTDWLCGFGPLFRSLLKRNGSIVLELGNSWDRGQPTMSNLALKTLIQFQEQNELYLCQEFIWHNTAKLPTPAQWVNVERIRLKDSFTRLWWLSPTPRPKADNRRVLVDYSNSMKKLLARGTYNSGVRISEHRIGAQSFLGNKGGAIAPNVLAFGNTTSRSVYLDYCKANGLTPHPARMPLRLAEFFIKFLTRRNDLVFDPFAGSNTTGYAAERLERYWLTIECNSHYIEGSKAYFGHSR